MESQGEKHTKHKDTRIFRYCIGANESLQTNSDKPFRSKKYISHQSSALKLWETGFETTQRSEEDCEGKRESGRHFDFWWLNVFKPHAMCKNKCTPLSAATEKEQLGGCCKRCNSISNLRNTLIAIALYKTNKIKQSFPFNCVPQNFTF